MLTKGRTQPGSVPGTPPGGYRRPRMWGSPSRTYHQMPGTGGAPEDSPLERKGADRPDVHGQSEQNHTSPEASLSKHSHVLDDVVPESAQVVQLPAMGAGSPAPLTSASSPCPHPGRSLCEQAPLEVKCPAYTQDARPSLHEAQGPVQRHLGAAAEHRAGLLTQQGVPRVPAPQDRTWRSNTCACAYSKAPQLAPSASGQLGTF